MSNKNLSIQRKM